MKFKLVLAFSVLVAGLFSSCSEETTNIPNPEPEPGDKPLNPPVTIEFPNDKIPQLMFKADGGKEQIQFSTTGDWKASLSAENSVTDWIRFSPSFGGKGQHVVDVVATANDKTDERMVVLCLHTKDNKVEIPIVQEEKKVILTDKDEVKVDHKGSSFYLSVKANITYDVQIDVDWITQKSSRALGETQLEFVVEKNAQSVDRVGKIELSARDKSVSRPVVVKQLGKESSVDDWGEGNDDWWKPNDKDSDSLN